MRWLPVVLVVSLLSSGCFKRRAGGEVPFDDAAAGGEPEPEPEAEAAVPTDPTALLAFLQQGKYQGFAAEPTVRIPFGPHGLGGIRVFFNALLDDSVEAGALEHPKSSAAVAELYDVDASTLVGWAVSVKVSSDSGGGLGWYWYQIDSTDNPALVAGEGTGLGLCTGCHASGDDYVLTPPL